MPKAVAAATPEQLSLSVEVNDAPVEIAVGIDGAVKGLGASVGDTVTLGRYEQDADLNNGAEPITWKVLDVKDGKALLVSEYGLEMKQYNPSSPVNWEGSSLRAWLNGDFYTNAFAPGERELVAYSTLDTKGLSTQDYAFILSLDEVNVYYPNKASFATNSTRYVKTVYANLEYNWRFLRSQPNNDRAYDANVDGTRGTSNYNYVNKYRLINPAVWVWN